MEMPSLTVLIKYSKKFIQLDEMILTCRWLTIKYAVYKNKRYFQIVDECSKTIEVNSDCHKLSQQVFKSNKVISM